MSNLELIFFGGIAIFFAYRIWTVAGKTGGNEKARATEMSLLAERQRAAAKEEQAGKAGVKTADGKLEKLPEEKIPEHLAADFAAVKKIDKTFTYKALQTGVVDSFELVLKLFGENKKEALQAAVSKEVFSGFEAELKAREASGNSYGNFLVTLEEPEVLDIELKGNACQAIVKFASEQINFMKNANNEVVEGSTTQTEYVADVWVFEYNFSAKKPSWIVIGIQE